MSRGMGRVGNLRLKSKEEIKAGAFISAHSSKLKAERGKRGKERRKAQGIRGRAKGEGGRD